MMRFINDYVREIVFLEQFKIECDVLDTAAYYISIWLFDRFNIFTDCNISP